MKVLNYIAISLLLAGTGVLLHYSGGFQLPTASRDQVAQREDKRPQKPAVIIVSAMAPLQAALRPLFERFAAGRAGTSR